MGNTIKRALITGITGQDGAYLAKFLAEKGYKVFGSYRRLSTPNFWRLHYLGIFDKVELIPMEISDSNSIYDALEKSNPSELYNFAAQSFVEVSFAQPTYTANVTGLGVSRILDEIRKFNPKIRLYQASSSEMFGSIKSKVMDENTAFHPASPYAIAKLYSHWMVKLYRDAYNLHATNGILFNHESPIRGLEFVTRKISNGVAKISLGLTKTLLLGNLDAKRDWGYAPEYVEGIWQMTQQKNSDDYVLATNETHSVREFAYEACRLAGISTSKIKSSKTHLRPLDVANLQGDYTKAHKNFGWKPKTTFKKLVKLMVESDIERWQKWLKKEYQPWDAVTSGQDSSVLGSHIKN